MELLIIFLILSLVAIGFLIYNMYVKGKTKNPEKKHFDHNW